MTNQEVQNDDSHSLKVFKIHKKKKKKKLSVFKYLNRFSSIWLVKAYSQHVQNENKQINKSLIKKKVIIQFSLIHAISDN